MAYQNNRSNIREPEKALRKESISTKIVVEGVIFLVVVVLTRAFHVKLPHHFGLSWNISLALTFALLFFLIHRRRERKKLPMRNIYIAENVVDALMLSHLLFLFGHINGILFFFYGFVIMEAALNLDRIIPFFIASTAAIAMLFEFLFLVFRDEIVLGLDTVLFAILRMAFLFLMARYSYTLAGIVIETKMKSKQIEEQSEQLKEALSELQKIDETKSDFISIASHQLRTPLTAIKGYVSMFLEGDYGRLGGKAKKSMENIFTANERLIGLVNSLLDISRIEAGKVKLEPSKVDLKRMLENMVADFSSRIANKKIKIIFESQPANIPAIQADEKKIREVFSNLVDNAIKYTKEGSIKVELKIIHPYLRVAITDTGIGMAQEEINGLFHSFSRGKEGKSMWVEGAGLGLYVAKKFMEMHRGRIWAESEGRGKGSKFIIELPIKL